VWVFIQIFAVDSKMRIFAAMQAAARIWAYNLPFNVFQIVPRSIILVPIESAYATSY